jgi:hypothetical protein
VTALVIVSVLAMSVTLIWGILVTVQFRKALESAFLHATRSHQRQSAQLDKVLDRFMALDFERFKSYELAGESEPGGFVAPEEQVSPPQDNLVQVYPSWGSLDRTAAAVEAWENEETLVAEDFPDENR